MPLRLCKKPCKDGAPVTPVLQTGPPKPQLSTSPGLARGHLTAAELSSRPVWPAFCMCGGPGPLPSYERLVFIKPSGPRVATLLLVMSVDGGGEGGSVQL